MIVPVKSRGITVLNWHKSLLNICCCRIFCFIQFFSFCTFLFFVLQSLCCAASIKIITYDGISLEAELISVKGSDKYILTHPVPASIFNKFLDAYEKDASARFGVSELIKHIDKITDANRNKSITHVTWLGALEFSKWFSEVANVKCSLPTYEELTSYSRLSRKDHGAEWTADCCDGILPQDPCLSNKRFVFLELDGSEDEARFAKSCDYISLSRDDLTFRLVISN